MTGWYNERLDPDFRQALNDDMILRLYGKSNPDWADRTKDIPVPPGKTAADVKGFVDISTVLDPEWRALIPHSFGVIPGYASPSAPPLWAGATVPYGYLTTTGICKPYVFTLSLVKDDLNLDPVCWVFTGCVEFVLSAILRHSQCLVKHVALQARRKARKQEKCWETLW